MVHTHTSFTHNSLTRNFVTHNSLTHYSFTYNFVTCVALGDIELHFVTSTFSLCGPHALTALGWLWWRAWPPVVGCDAAVFCVVGVVLGDMHAHFAGQVWHFGHWAGSGGRRGLLRGRRGRF